MIVRYMGLGQTFDDTVEYAQQAREDYRALVKVGWEKWIEAIIKGQRDLRSVKPINQRVP